jgi:hypothetical protein
VGYALIYAAVYSTIGFGKFVSRTAAEPLMFSRSLSPQSCNQYSAGHCKPQTYHVGLPCLQA